MTWNIYQPIFRFQTFKNSRKGVKRGNQQKHELQQHGQKHGVSSIKEAFYSLFRAFYSFFAELHKALADELMYSELLRFTISTNVKKDVEKLYSILYQ
jgi:hypothetical protein